MNATILPLLMKPPILLLQVPTIEHQYPFSHMPPLMAYTVTITPGHHSRLQRPLVGFLQMVQSLTASLTPAAVHECTSECGSGKTFRIVGNINFIMFCLFYM